MITVAYDDSIILLKHRYSLGRHPPVLDIVQGVSKKLFDV